MTPNDLALANNPQYRDLQQQHRSYETQLEELNRKAWLTPAEEMEAKQIKKLKLRVKDEMERLRRSSVS